MFLRSVFLVFIREETWYFSLHLLKFVPGSTYLVLGNYLKIFLIFLSTFLAVFLSLMSLYVKLITDEEDGQQFFVESQYEEVSLVELGMKFRWRVEELGL